MLSKEVFLEGFKHLGLVYPNWKIDLSTDRNINAWYFYFKDLNEATFRKMIVRYATEETAYPTVAGLLKAKTQMQQPNSKSFKQIQKELEEQGYDIKQEGE